MGKSLIARVDENGWLPLAVRLFLGGYFISTGIVKIQDPALFLKGINLYGLLPTEPPIFLNAATVFLPWLEVICGVALILGLARRGGALLIAIMLAVFTPAILMKGLSIQGASGISFFDVKFDCGCGTGEEYTWLKLCKNTGLFLLAMVSIFSCSARFTLGGWLVRGRAIGENPSSCTHDQTGNNSDVCPECDTAS